MPLIHPLCSNPGLYQAYVMTDLSFVLCLPLFVTLLTAPGLIILRDDLLTLGLKKKVGMEKISIYRKSCPNCEEVQRWRNLAGFQKPVTKSYRTQMLKDTVLLIFPWEKIACHLHVLIPLYHPEKSLLKISLKGEYE